MVKHMRFLVMEKRNKVYLEGRKQKPKFHGEWPFWCGGWNLISLLYHSLSGDCESEKPQLRLSLSLFRLHESLREEWEGIYSGKREAREVACNMQVAN